MGDPRWPSGDPIPADQERAPDRKLSFPSKERLLSCENRELARTFFANHARLLERVKALRPESIPYFGLHGTQDLETLTESIDKPGNQKTFEVVTVFEKRNDPNAALIDLYDVVGGVKPYFREPRGKALLMLNMEDGNGGTIGERWGAEGEAKNWNIAGGDRGFRSAIRYFRDELGMTLSAEDIEMLTYFESTGGGGKKAHAQKSMIPNDQFHSRLLKVTPTAETLTYLDTTITWNDYSLPPGESAENDKRGFMAEMLYVQSVAEGLLEVFEEEARKNKAPTES